MAEGGIIIRKYNAPEQKLKHLRNKKKNKNEKKTIYYVVQPNRKKNLTVQPLKIEQKQYFYRVDLKDKQEAAKQITHKNNRLIQETVESSVKRIGKKQRTHISRSNERCSWTSGNEARVVKQI